MHRAALFGFRHWWPLIALLLVCAPAGADRLLEREAPVESSNPPELARLDPIQFLEMLQVPSGGLPFVTIVEPVANWIRAEHIPALVALLDSRDSCKAVVSAKASFVPPESTVGNEAAMMIMGHRAGRYPSELHAAFITPEQRSDLRAWWTETSTQSSPCDTAIEDFLLAPSAMTRKPLEQDATTCLGRFSRSAERMARLTERMAEGHEEALGFYLANSFELDSPQRDAATTALATLAENDLEKLLRVVRRSVKPAFIESATLIILGHVHGKDFAAQLASLERRRAALASTTAPMARDERKVLSYVVDRQIATLEKQHAVASSSD